MDLNRFKDWLGTLEGILLLLFTGVTTLSSAWSGSIVWLGSKFSALGMTSIWWPRIVLIAIFLTLFGYAWRSYTRFAKASRLIDATAFILSPTTPGMLVGRADDLKKWIVRVKTHRLSLMDGESGCGKSALVSAGIVPMLHEEAGLIPLAIQDWGEDWERGPLTETLDLLFRIITPAQRDAIGWRAAPNLTLTSPELAHEISLHLRAILSILGQRLLIIADQFDDYQTHHQHRFLEPDGSWTTPRALAERNMFWKMINEGLREGYLHALVVTRDDNAAGLACIRFIQNEQISASTLRRVEAGLLRPLLSRMAAQAVKDGTLTHPDGGWAELQDRIEEDLQGSGAVLMQQVRTVLRGLQHLKLLTPRDYKTAGGIRGIERLFVTAVLKSAGALLRLGDDGESVARSVLRAFVVPAANSQPEGYQQVTLATLSGSGRSEAQLEDILQLFEDQQVIRSVGTNDQVRGWQLSHAYLVPIILEEASSKDKWSAALKTGHAAFRRASNDRSRQFANLLPVWTLVRIVWERLRGRLQFDAAAKYVLVSALRPAFLVFVSIAIIGSVHAIRAYAMLEMSASQLAGQLSQPAAILSFWRADVPLRAHVYKRVLQDQTLTFNLSATEWALAYAGADAAAGFEVANLVLSQIENPANSEQAEALFDSYINLVIRHLDSGQLRPTVQYFAKKMAEDPKKFTRYFCNLRKVFLAKISNQSDLTNEVAEMRELLSRSEIKYDLFSCTAEQILVVAGRLHRPVHPVELSDFLLKRAAELSDGGDMFERANFSLFAGRYRLQFAVLKRDLNLLLDGMSSAGEKISVETMAIAYVTAVETLHSESLLAVQAGRLRAYLQSASESNISSFGICYRAVLAAIHSPVERHSEAKALREMLRLTQKSVLARELTESYVIAIKGGTEIDHRSEAAAWRDDFPIYYSEDRLVGRVNALRAFASVAVLPADSEFLSQRTLELRTVADTREDSHAQLGALQAYAAVMARFGPREIRSARDVIVAKVQANWLDSDAAEAYVFIVTQLDDVDAKKAAEDLLPQLISEADEEVATSLHAAYEQIVGRLDNSTLLRHADRIRDAMLANSRPYGVSNLANRYASVMHERVRQALANHVAPQQLITDALILASHPYLSKPEVILNQLTQLSGKAFGDDLAEAVRWAGEVYGIKAVNLRPQMKPSVKKTALT